MSLSAPRIVHDDPPEAEVAPACVLIVEDSPCLRESLGAFFAARDTPTLLAATVADAAAHLATATPTLAVVDLALPDGTAFDVLRLLERLPRLPAIIAMSGSASPDDAFRLAGRGVRAYLSKPIDPDELAATVARVTTQPPNLAPQLRSVVGWIGIHDLERQVRETLLDEAIERTAGNRSAAARLLKVSRQLIQHMVRERNA